MDLSDINKIDLHMHTSCSDGTDTPSVILQHVKDADIKLFSITDHDGYRGCLEMIPLLSKEGPRFLSGIEFSCKDEGGKYHILGYGYDPYAASMIDIVEKGHRIRMGKVRQRLQGIKEKFGFSFSKEDLEDLFKNENPGKPHIGNLMVRYGYADNKNIAITKYINQIKVGDAYIRPEEAIEAVLKAGGVPVLAHPSYGSGEELYVGQAMEERVKWLLDMGLQGLEAYYSGFTKQLEEENLALAHKYHLYVTAGSDYHGKNKLVELGDTNLKDLSEADEAVFRFLTAVREKIY